MKTLAFILCLVAGSMSAATWPSNGSQSDVQSIHNNQAQDGDTITLPAGTFTWNVHVGFTKAVNITGAGQGVTTINDNVPKTGGGNSVLWSFSVAAGKSIRITGFTIHGQAQDDQNFNAGTLNIAGGSHSVRVDHVSFIAPGTGCMIFDGDIWGLVDHCYFERAFKQGVQIHHGNWGGTGVSIWGDTSFEDSLHLGTNQAIYIEDCTFVDEGEGGCVDGTYGGRCVFRHNDVRNTFVGMHGTEGFRGRGMRSFEIYDNFFHMTSTGNNGNGIIFTGIFWRSGVGVVFNNTFVGAGGETGFHDMIQFTTFRAPGCSDQNGSPWGRADGTNPWDTNTAGVAYPCIDQVGWGTCLDQIRGDNPINQRTGTAAFPRNQIEPIYTWNNSWSSIPNNPGSKHAYRCTVMQAGREVKEDTVKPGYTSFTYPHPLQGASPTPTATASPSATPTSTATATATFTPTPTATATATFTPTPTATATTTATPTVTPSGVFEIDIPNVGSPPDDPTLQLIGHLYVPDASVHPPPWKVIVGTVADNFKTNNSGTMSKLNGPFTDLATHGFMCLAAEVRLTNPVAGQTTTGRWHQQTDDLKRAIRAMRSNPFGMGFSVTGVVGAIGGSGAGHHALYMAVDGTNGDDKADASVCLSPVTDMGDREADIVGPIGDQFITDVTTYGDTTTIATLTARSPIALNLVGASPILLYNGNAENPGMPLSNKTLFDAAMASAGGKGAMFYTSVLNTGSRGTLHAFNYWNPIRTNVMTWLDTNLVAQTDATPTPTATVTPTATATASATATATVTPTATVPQAKFPLIQP